MPRRQNFLEDGKTDRLRTPAWRTRRLWSRMMRRSGRSASRSRRCCSPESTARTCVSPSGSVTADSFPHTRRRTGNAPLRNHLTPITHKCNGMCLTVFPQPCVVLSMLLACWPSCIPVGSLHSWGNAIYPVLCKVHFVYTSNNHTSYPIQTFLFKIPNYSWQIDN